jgi:hypothetical protein
MKKMKMATQSIKEIFFDMDGVLSDLDKRLDEVGISKDLPRAEFWEKVKETPRFWIGMKMMPGAKQLVEYAESLKVPISILTSPSKSDPKCKPGKLVWARAHGLNFPIHFKRAPFKHEYAQPGAVLIDDKPETIEAWNKAGGIGILHTSLAQTLTELKKHVN